MTGTRRQTGEGAGGAAGSGARGAAPGRAQRASTRAAPPRALDCLLQGLADPRLGGATPGLDLLSMPLAADPRHFACCGGTATRLDPTCDVTRACALNSRLREARKLAALYARLHDEENTTGFTRVVSQSVRLSPVLERLHAISIGRSRKGLAFLVTTAPALGPGAGPAPSPAAPSPRAPAASTRSRPTAPQGAAPSPLPSVWTVALAAAWRFGLRPHVVVLGKTPPADLVPRFSTEAPQLLCIGNVDGLWDAHASDQLDALVGYAYSTLTPLFVELVLRPGAAPDPATAASRTSKAFARRIGSLRSKSPLAWLPPACAGKLPDVTDGLDDLVRQAEREQAAETSAGKSRGMPRLPWD